MDTTDMIRHLEYLLTSSSLDRKDRRFIESCLPELNAGTIDPADYDALEAIVVSDSIGLKVSSSDVKYNNSIANSSANTINQHTQSGGVNASQAQFGDNTTVVGGDYSIIIEKFFDNSTPDDGEENIHHYLKKVIIEQYQSVRLERLTNRKISGSEQTIVPKLQLSDIYASLVILDKQSEDEQVCTKAAAEEILRNALVKDSESVLPEQRQSITVWETQYPEKKFTPYELEEQEERKQWDEISEDAEMRVHITRPLLATESLAPRLDNKQRVGRTLLLADPGWGKSTLLHYAALCLAESIIQNRSLPRGWSQPYIPIVCSLAQIATEFERNHQDRECTILWTFIEHQIEGSLRLGSSKYVRRAIKTESIALFFDGLDEVSAEPLADGKSIRSKVCSAIVELGRKEIPLAVPIVVTSRVQSYNDQPTEGENQWRFSSDDKWNIYYLAPLELIQVKNFIKMWYEKTPDSIYNSAQISQRIDNLYVQISERISLHDLVKNPLLLTMIMILHYNRNEDILPEDESQLYEELVTLLIERWESIRVVDKVYKGIIAQLQLENVTNMTNIRQIIEDIAFIGHSNTFTDTSYRGLISDTEIYYKLNDFFEAIYGNKDVQSYKQSRDMFMNTLSQRSGLLQKVGDHTYTFPHLTFQEYLAACYLARSPEPLKESYQVWDQQGGDKWRKTLLLFAGKVQVDKMSQIGIPWLNLLLSDTTPDVTPKTNQQLQRDGLLAFDTYQGWTRSSLRSLGSRGIERIEEDIKSGLIVILNAQEPVFIFSQRVEIANNLAHLGDIRFPISEEQWYSTFSHCSTTFTQSGDHYWRYIRAGTYKIGGWEADDPVHEAEASEFWIARFPITVAQYRYFVAQGGYNHDEWWTEEVQRWLKDAKEPENRYFWQDSDKLQSNHPVVNINLYEAMAFCKWLSSFIPNYTIRLPSNSEWEAMAYYDKNIQRLNFPWGIEPPNQELAVLNHNNGAQSCSAIGVCAPGMAPCGALDVIGNVWEWTNSQDVLYPHDNSDTDAIINEDSLLSVRGSSWSNSPLLAHPMHRFKYNPNTSSDNLGFRLICTPNKL